MQITLQTRGVAAVVLTLSFATTLSAQGNFSLLGRGTARSVADDGTVVGGHDGGGVYRWTVAGKQSLGQQPAVVVMSGDGSVISSNMSRSQTPSGLGEAGRWTQATGWVALGGLSGSCSGTVTSTYGMNADGSVIVGLGWTGCVGRAFRWDAGIGMTNLGGMNPRQSTRANAVSGDGQFVGGWDESPMTGQRRAAIWFPTGQEILIVPPSAQNSVGAGEVWGFNQSGSIAVGGDSPNAFRWTTASGFEDLGAYPGTPPGAAVTGTAYATNDDGSVIVGSSGSFFVGYGAFIWTEEDGMRTLDSYLEQQNVTIPSGPRLAWAMDISPDGRFIVGGRGDFRSFDDEGYLVQLPDGVKYGQGAASANNLDLAGSSSALGATFVATTTGPIATTVTVLAAGAARFPFLGGVALVDVTGPIVLLSAPASGGVSTVSFPIPLQPGLVGQSFHMQSLSPDPRQAGGWALSNGLKVTVHS